MRVDVYVAVPYHSLAFLAAGDRYVADYAVLIEVADAETEKVEVETYKAYSVVQNTSEFDAARKAGVDRADATQYSFILAQGREFKVRIGYRDLTNRREWDTTVAYATRRFSSTSVDLSDLMFYRARRGQNVLPFIGSDLAELDAKTGGMFAEIYGLPQSQAIGYVRRVVLAGSRDEEVSRSSGVFVGTGEERMPVFLEVPADEIWMGRYVVQLFLFNKIADTSKEQERDLKSAAVAFTEREIEMSLQRGLPILDDDLDDAIAQLAYIATGGEWDSLYYAESRQEKRAALQEFWRKRNPDPYSNTNIPMQVFYRRVQYANENFSFGGPGWRSDRGRTYIQLGTPTMLDRQPYGVNQKPYEVWDYYDLNTQYVFVDHYMLNDYRLLGTGPPQGLFFWRRDSY